MPEGQTQKTAIGELRQLKSLIEEVQESLRSQREILKRRGMNLPPMALQAVSSIKSDLDTVENTLIEEQTELGQLRALADTTTIINSSLDLNEVLTQAMDVVISLTNAERGYIILKDPDTGELDFRITREMEIGHHHGDGVQISRTIINDVMDTCEAMLADNAYKDERLQGNLSVANLALRSVLCVPLKYRDEVRGVVYVDNRLRSGVFTDREKNLLSAFANQAAVAIENARLYTNIQATLAEIIQIKELMSNVFASIGSGVITTNDSDHVITFNRAASNILEKTEDEAIGKRIRSLVPLTNTDLDEYLARVRELNEREYIDAELEVTHRGRIALSMKLSPLKDLQQQTQGVAVVLDDLTEQRAREEMMGIMTRYLPPQLVHNIDSISQLGLGGERREVTCIFVDVMPMAAFRHLPPQQLMETLNRYLAVATEAVHSSEGIIDKYMGNEIMGIFNSQLNPSDQHALKAVEAALAMRDSFHDLYAQLGINPDPPFYRIGIHTGVATLGNVGSLSRRDFSAIGDTINTAHRIMENAKESQILVSDDTGKHIEATMHDQALTVQVEERGSIHVKGREKPVHIYEVFRA